MNVRKMFFSISLFLFYGDRIFCQEYVDSSKSLTINSTDTSPTMFNVHLGFGIINGGRIGALIRINETVSFEAAYGKDFRSFLAASDEVIQYSIGVNWQPIEFSNFTASFLVSYHDAVLLSSKSILLSPTIGLMNLHEKYLRLFIRAGFAMKVYDFDEKEFAFNWIYPNLDIGLNWNF